MTIKDLKFGDIVTTRDGMEWIYTKDKLTSNKEYFYANERTYYDDLRSIEFGKNYDVMKIQRYVQQQHYFINREPGLGLCYDLQTIYERVENILDKKEKEYLRAVIKPFRDEIEYIIKDCTENCNPKEEWIHIELEHDYIDLPCFEENTMYKGMELNKEYSIEDLGL